MLTKRIIFLSSFLLILLLGLAACDAGGTDTGVGDTDTGAVADPTVGSDTAPDSDTGAAQQGPIQVASKSFTEAFILGEMYAQLLEVNGLEVERRMGLGSESVIHAAMLEGDVDLYPEYTSTGLLAILQQPAMQDRQEIYDTVKAQYEEQFDITWLDAAPFNNTQALAVTRETSDELGLTQVSQLLELGPQLRIGGPPEFFEREDGLPGLDATYGEMTFADERQVDAGLRYEALLNDEIDVVVAFGTDGQIGGYDLVVLEDDQGLWPPYQVAPVVRQEVLTNNPEIAEILNPLAPLLTDEVMADLNWMVDGPDQMEYEDVARTFLADNNLLPTE